MTDTPADIASRYRDLLLERSGEERLRMGCSMHATARALVLASILARDPRAGPGAIRQALFLRFYQADYDPDTGARVLARLGGDPGPRRGVGA